MVFIWVAQIPTRGDGGWRGGCRPVTAEPPRRNPKLYPFGFFSFLLVFPQPLDSTLKIPNKPVYSLRSKFENRKENQVPSLKAGSDSWGLVADCCLVWDLRAICVVRLRSAVLWCVSVMRVFVCCCCVDVCAAVYASVGSVCVRVGYSSVVFEAVVCVIVGYDSVCGDGFSVKFLGRLRLCPPSIVPVLVLL